ncbi:MAG: hypothetical protein NTW18_01960 [Candidatus Omnitrophica bacterium]|nr:hypothetical protein [Candidatus Omnitrophota bacterium]
MNTEVKKNIGMGVVIGIIVFSICYLLVQPMLNFITPKFLNLIAKCFSFLSNAIYANAAYRNTNSYDSFLFTFLMESFAFVFLIALALSFITKDRFRKFVGNLPEPKLWPIRIVCIIAFLLIGIMSIVEYSNDYLNLRFSHKVTIIAPYLSNQAEKELLAQWALMKNKKDYESLDNLLKNYAQANNIKEPKSLWK